MLLKEEKALVAQSKFEQKHPKLAKFFNSVKNIFNRKENKVEKNKEVEEEKEVKEEIKSQRDEFMDYLKQVAEKGMEKQAEDTLKEKFAQNKKEAYKRETEKFGKNYADRSYNSKENDEKELWREDKANLEKEVLDKKYSELTNCEYMKSLNDDFKNALEENYQAKRRKGLNIER